MPSIYLHGQFWTMSSPLPIDLGQVTNFKFFMLTSSHCAIKVCIIYSYDHHVVDAIEKATFRHCTKGSTEFRTVNGEKTNQM